MPWRSALFLLGRLTFFLLGRLILILLWRSTNRLYPFRRGWWFHWQVSLDSCWGLLRRSTLWRPTNLSFFRRLTLVVWIQFAQFSFFLGLLKFEDHWFLNQRIWHRFFHYSLRWWRFQYILKPCFPFFRRLWLFLRLLPRHKMRYFFLNRILSIRLLHVVSILFCFLQSVYCIKLMTVPYLFGPRGGHSSDLYLLLLREIPLRLGSS